MMHCLKCCGVFLSDVYIIEEAINQFADFEAFFVSAVPDIQSRGHKNLLENLTQVFHLLTP